jgi:hypothetical protein
MFKKILAISVVFATSLSTAFAGSFYIGPSIAYDSLRAGHIRYAGIYPVLSGGYDDWVWDWLYIAGEIFASPKSIDVNNEPKNGENLKTKYIYGVSIIPGINLDEMLLAYVRFGFASAKFQELDTTKGGTELGIGLETKLMDCWSVRAEYDYAKYSSIPSAGSLRADAFSLGAVYRFEQSRD